MGLQYQNRRSPGFWAELVKSFRLTWRLLRDPAVPFAAKLIPLAAAIYILAPIDLVPDPILGLGQLDDLTILILGVQIFIALSPRQIVRRHRDDMDGALHTDSSEPSQASKDIIDGK